jgi:hypothetical protein
MMKNEVLWGSPHSFLPSKKTSRHTSSASKGTKSKQQREHLQLSITEKTRNTDQNLGLLSSKWHQLMLLLCTHLKVLLVEVKSRRLHHLSTLDHLFLQTLLE